MTRWRKGGPSPKQIEALRAMSERGGWLFRCPGGYWTTRDLREGRREDGGYDVPAWSVGTTTVGAMEGRGWVESLGSGRWPPVRLTDAGRDLVGPWRWADEACSQCGSWPGAACSHACIVRHTRMAPR